MTTLEDLVPAGPLVPAGASEAKRARVEAVFAVEVDRARAAAPDGRVQLLNDALVQGDEILRAAVLTAAAEAGGPVSI